MKDTIYWRSLEELAHTEEFRAFVEDEFPQRTPDWNSAASRRKFLTLMGASVALAGAAGCTVQPKEVIVPYVRQPEEIVPGNPLFYATAVSIAGIATGLLIESHMGRPTKVEGNPQHPASLGATDARMQASLLTLYDPDRSQTVTHNGAIDDWGGFLTALAGVRDVAGLNKGEGVRNLTGTVTSPTLGSQLKTFLDAYPAAKWHQYEPCGRHSARGGATAAFGKAVNTIYRFDRADVIVALDADFLCSGMPGGIRYARDYAERRRAAAMDRSAMAPRLYAAEGTPSLTGGMAEHRFRMRSSEVEAFAASLLNDDASAVAKDLSAHRGASIVIAGEHQPPRVHAIAHAMNQTLGNAGKTVLYTDPVEANPVDELASLAELVSEMRSGAVQALIILGGNPVYDAPADFQFLDALQKVPFRAHLGLYSDETAAWCHWHVPEAHYLESWSDARAYDGTVSLVQPLIAPIYGGKTAHEILNVLNNQADASAHDAVRSYWSGRHKGKDFDDFWQVSLHDGVVEGTALPEITPPAAKAPDASIISGAGLEIVFRPDPAVGDGAMSNNAWLQEMPKPQNKMTWDNAVWISPKSAEHYGVTTGDVMEIAAGGRTVNGPAWIMPGHADESLTVHFGYGRTRAGKVANGVGFNAYAIRSSTAPWLATGARITRKSSGYRFATTQHTQTMEERDPFRVATLAEYHKDPQFADPPEDNVPASHSVFPLWE